MKSLFTPLIVAAAFLSGSLFLGSCANSDSGRGAGDGTFSAPAPVSSVEATDRMRSQFREMR